MSNLSQPLTPPEDTFWTIDQLIRQRAGTSPDLPLISYPEDGHTHVDYTALQLDVYSHRVGQIYGKNIEPRASSNDKTKVVGLLGLSNVEYLISALALSKLGMTVLFLSTRISEAAYISLLQATECSDLVVDSSLRKRAEALKAKMPLLNIEHMVTSKIYNYDIQQADHETAMDDHFDYAIENQNTAWIIHSSGSTGLPKPIFQTHAAVLRNYASNFAMRGYITLPLYHAHGISSVMRAIYSRKQIHMYSASMPLTSTKILETMTKFNFEIFYGVPYALKLLGESSEGLAALSKLKLTMFGGSSCPQELGDKLVRHGVKLISHYGTTETGQLMTSFREDGDLDWDYLRVSKSLEPFVRWEKTDEDHFELVVLDGWPSKVATNRSDGSYATRDLFARHPTKSNAFKWIGRIDDTLVLLNGEKANPIPIEHTVRENCNVAEVIVFGSSMPQLGMFVIPSTQGQQLPRGVLTESVTSSIEAANAQSPAYAQITPDMVRVLPHNTIYPCTDKGTVIRAAFYAHFKQDIEQVYSDLLNQNTSGGRIMCKEELEQFLHTLVVDTMRLEETSMLTDETDFFSLGLDSLQALHIHSAIIKNYNTNGHKISQNVVFEYPNLKALAAYLTSLNTGSSVRAESQTSIMHRLLEKHSTFRPHQPKPSKVERRAVLCTGATGSLGAHVVAQLCQKPDVETIYCLVRAESPEKANIRVISSMHQRQIYHSLLPEHRKKIVALPSDLGLADLGLRPSTLEQLRARVSAVIHLAWAVNFNMGIESFEAQHIAGVHNLIQFCLDSYGSTPAAFYFGSSVSAVAATPKEVQEAVDNDPNHAQGMGYARSKWVAENICSRATQQTNIIARVHRIGQVVGDTESGIWNATEAIPLMTQAATTIGALPALDEYPTWLPVDVVASSIVDLSFLSPSAVAPNQVFHIVNPTTFHWTRDYLPALRTAGLDFQTISPKDWIKRLRESNPDPVQNPPFKLLEFFASKYDREDARPSLYFKTDITCAHSRTLHSAPGLSPAQVAKFVNYWQTKCWTSQIRLTTATALVIAGPCGTGKSTLAKALANHFSVPWVEADVLHSPEAISKMNRGDPLQDEDRWSWLEKIKRRALGEAVGHQGVILTCSALRARYRDVLRNVPADIRVVFFMLEAEPDRLKERLFARTDHFMKADMVESQITLFESPRKDEADVIPFNVSDVKEVIVQRAINLAKQLVFQQDTS